MAGVDDVVGHRARVAEVIAAHLLRTGLPVQRAAITAAAIVGAVQQGRWLTGDGSPRSVRTAMEQVVDVVRCLVPDPHLTVPGP